MGWALVLFLLAGCFLVLRPFISSLVWAVVLVFSCWPVYERILAFCGHRKTLAASLITLGLVLLLLMPFVLVGPSLVGNVTEATAAVRRWLEAGPPAPPDWLAKLPVVGARAVDYWQQAAHDSANLWQDSRQLIEPLSSFLLRCAVGIGSGVIELALSLIIAFFLFCDGASLAERLSRTVNRVGGAHGRRLLGVARDTIRGVVYGIIGTALLQAVLAGFGYLLAGLPAVGLLVMLTFIASVLPVLGTGAVWLPAAFWLFHQGSTGWAIFMLIWGIGISALANVVQPWLISRGNAMPFLLVFFGVLGGAMAFGFIGLFLGPTLLSVGFRLAQEWTEEPSPVAAKEPEPVVPV